VSGRLKLLIALAATLAAFVIYAICYRAFDLPYGMRSVWPGFVFVFVIAMYLSSKPLAEEDDA
jgi:hypothetical protein